MQEITAAEWAVYYVRVSLALAGSMAYWWLLIGQCVRAVDVDFISLDLV